MRRTVRLFVLQRLHRCAISSFKGWRIKFLKKIRPLFLLRGTGAQRETIMFPQRIIDQNKARWGRRGGLGEREPLPRERRPNGGRRPCPLRRRKLRASTAAMRGSLSPKHNQPSTAYFFLSMISRMTLSASRMPEEPRRPRLAMQASISSSTMPSLPGTDLPSMASMAA